MANMSERIETNYGRLTVELLVFAFASFAVASCKADLEDPFSATPASTDAAMDLEATRNEVHAQDFHMPCGDGTCDGTAEENCYSCPQDCACEGGFECGPDKVCIKQLCQPDCADKGCGDDGCGSPCEVCPGQDQCVAGQCVCQPNCTDRDCGPDDCDGHCGACQPGHKCTNEGLCMPVEAVPPTVKGDIIITEFMAKPAAGESQDMEWLEFYNSKNLPVTLAGCSLRDLVGSHTMNADNGSVVVPPKDYLLAVSNSDPAMNGGTCSSETANALVPSCAQVYEYGQPIVLNNTGEETLKLFCDGRVIDEVKYDGKSSVEAEWPILLGISLQLSKNKQTDQNAYFLNNSGVNWCLGQDTFGDGLLGTPGKANTVNCGSNSAGE